MIANLLRTGLFVAALGIAGCNETSIEMATGDANAPIAPRLVQIMKSKSMSLGSPILARVFKEENKVEIWKQKTNGRYDLLASYEICKMSGKLGPKFIEGDRQSPEGFYTVRPGQMNPKSSYHLAFNVGYPNAFDRANNRTGANIMVHGACSSSGCFSMNDGQMTEIYAVARESFKGGQTEFQIQSFPFRMTAANMARYKDDPNYGFWKNLKEGYDHFEISKVPPKVDVCEKRYVFDAVAENGTTFSPAGQCPSFSQPDSLKVAYQSYKSGYDAAFTSAISAGTVPAPKPSILGVKEASLVSEWTKKRARGERITIEPPSMKPDGSVAQSTLRMGRIDSPAGRKMAAKEAEDTARQQAALAAEEAKQAAIRAKEEAKRAAAQAKADSKLAAAAAKEAKKTAAAMPAATPQQAQSEPALTEAAAPAEAKPGILGRIGKRFTNMFGS